MTGKTGVRRSTNIALGAGAGAVVVLIALLFWDATHLIKRGEIQVAGAAGDAASQAPAAESTTGTSAATDGVAQPATQSETPSETQIATQGTSQQAVDPVAGADALSAVPQFDVVRIAPDGAALIAGRAAPGAQVILRLDGAEVVQAESGEDGQFAVMFELPAADQPREITLYQRGADGQERAALASVAVAPFAARIDPAEAASSGNAAAQNPVAPEAGAPLALLLSDEGVKVLQSGLDDPASSDKAVLPEGQVVINSISYLRSGGVQIGGQGLPGAAVRLYLDNQPAGEALAGGDGVWRLALKEVEPGLYTLRADALDAAGAVRSRFEIPFRRESPEALAAVLKPRATHLPAAGAEAHAQAAHGAVSAGGAGTGRDQLAAAVGALATLREAEDGQQVPLAAQPQRAEPAAGLEAGAASEAPAAGATAVAATTATAAPTTVPPVASPGDEALTVTVQPGYSLWRIAERRLGDGRLYVQVFRANRHRIRNPDLIYPGQVFTLPQVQPAPQQ